MQNPFTTTFSKTPEYTYIHTEKTEEILENFIYDNPSESVYKITGVRGSGKTVILAKAGFGSQDKKTTGIDEVSKSEEMVKFASEYGRWLRAGYPVYFVCTGLYENIQELSNVKNLTFFRRAATVKTEPLNMIRMTEMYKSKLDIDSDEAREMAKITKGYAYAFQELGVLYFKKKLDELLEDILPKLKAELFAYSYEKIWEEMTEMDRFLAGLLTEKEEYKREEVLKLMGEKSGSYSMYRDRLIKRGILNSRQGYISLALPYFGEYIKEYC